MMHFSFHFLNSAGSIYGENTLRDHTRDVLQEHQQHSVFLLEVYFVERYF